jgi:vancomycin resistance protein YoaR
MEEKNKQEGESMPEEQASAREEAVEKETGLESGEEPEPVHEHSEPEQVEPDAASEPASAEQSEEDGSDVAAQDSGRKAREEEEKSSTEGDGKQDGAESKDDRAFDTMELNLLDKLDTGNDGEKERAESPSERETEESTEPSDSSAGPSLPEQPAIVNSGEKEEQEGEEQAATQKEEAAEEEPAAHEEADGEKPGESEQGSEQASAQEQPQQQEEEEVQETQSQAQDVKQENSEGGQPVEPVAAAAATGDQDTGVFTVIRKEIQNTPKPKKILVGTIATAMVLAGLIGLSAYASNAGKVGTSPGGGVQAEQPKPAPAKLQLYLEDKKFELDLNSIGYNGKDLSTIDEAKLRTWLDQVKKQVDQEPKNAYQKKIGGPVTPEKPGRKMDVRTVETWLKDLKPFINKPVEIPMVTVQPSVTTEDLKNVMGKLIGKYTTKFDPGNVNRTTNIKLASRAIDGLILMPGDTFSFNRVVGPRTASRGYKPAKVIVKGEYSEGIGGGICQVSSTLYNSVDEAGLKITRRASHSKEVTYVPPGRDATVSWGGPDFRFKNNLNKPVLIDIKISGGYITVYTYTVPGARVARKKVPQAPESFTTIQVDPNKPTENLPKTGQ